MATRTPDCRRTVQRFRRWWSSMRRQLLSLARGLSASGCAYRGAVAATVDARGWVALRSKERPWAVDLVGATTALRATGDWDLERMSSLGMKFEGELLDVGRLLPKHPLAAGIRVGGAGSFSGPWNAPTAFDVTGRASSLREHPLLGAFTADASFRREGGAVRFSQMHYRSLRGEVDGSGSVGLFSGRSLYRIRRWRWRACFAACAPSFGCTVASS